LGDRRVVRDSLAGTVEVATAPTAGSVANPAGIGLTFAGALAGSILANDAYGIATRGRAD